ncbi:hypothetical protein AV530_007334 [Patagioenas fasciata monilis]|uniref:Uncharacterized protein n=1 Tax=Patagioenas fasciata monilis TaxID=372326 RepID=A0A1V4JXL4_PATFA|nr:hypothetical protein AV530_007334 [Patagioenas fasciata monilis]
MTQALPDCRATAADWRQELSVRQGRGCCASSTGAVPAQNGGNRWGRVLSASALARRGGNAAAAAAPLAGPGPPPPGGTAHGPAPPLTEADMKEVNHGRSQDFALPVSTIANNQGTRR